ncbi:DUF1254 domain-containing protein [Pseudomonas citronellolis]|uniref:DUF1254 domain-containing protein n=1 Tax=Pseudomonas citronellolis TaxID=53408 RepID=UPI0021C01FCC|nr:DUF1214 domain-containing protein [Pseudomonas citronellolis]UXJ55504.1 DUF1214 domain-containing protein [Pseudomonas citronellolis]
MCKHKKAIQTLGILLLATQLHGYAHAQPIQEPLNGQPEAGSRPSVSDFDYQVKYQRAFEAVLWSLPRVQTQGGREATLGGLGIKDNDIVAMSGTATPKFETWTANSSTPYVFAYSDLKREPVVLEVPPAGPDGSLYGQVVDAWQRTIADIGPSGIDAGRGDKLLLTGPDFKGTVPAGYRQVVSPTRRIVFAFRSVRAPGKSAADAYAYAKRLKMYYLSQAAKPPQQRFADPVKQRYSSLLPQDERYFQLLHDTVTYEPVQPEDKHMLGLLASLGIEQGKPYQPDEKTRRAMRQAVVDVWYYLQQRFDQLPRGYYYWPDRQYVPLLLPDANRGFGFDYPGRIDVDGRALAFFWCTLVPRQVPERPAAYYLMAMADSQGRPLEAGASYRLVVPADMPVKQFWSLTLYDRATMAFIYTRQNRTTLDSYGLDKMKKNADGSVTLYVGPQAPRGLESNWIPTGGKRPLPALRFYGGTDALFDKQFKMPDFERIDEPAAAAAPSATPIGLAMGSHLLP